MRIKEEKNSGPVLSQASSTTIILPAQVSMTTVQSPTTDPVSPVSNTEKAFIIDRTVHIIGTYNEN